MNRALRNFRTLLILYAGLAIVVASAPFVARFPWAAGSVGLSGSALMLWAVARSFTDLNEMRNHRDDDEGK